MLSIPSYQISLPLNEENQPDFDMIHQNPADFLFEKNSNLCDHFSTSPITKPQETANRNDW